MHQVRYIRDEGYERCYQEGFRINSVPPDWYTCMHCMSQGHFRAVCPRLRPSSREGPAFCPVGDVHFYEPPEEEAPVHAGFRCSRCITQPGGGECTKQALISLLVKLEQPIGAQMSPRRGVAESKELRQTLAGLELPVLQASTSLARATGEELAQVEEAFIRGPRHSKAVPDMPDDTVHLCDACFGGLPAGARAGFAQTLRPLGLIGRGQAAYAEAVSVADRPRRVAANNDKEFKEKAMLLYFTRQVEPEPEPEPEDAEPVGVLPPPAMWDGAPWPYGPPPCPRPPGAVKRPSRSLAFSCENPFCIGLLYGRAGRLTAKNGGFPAGQWWWSARARWSTST
jgi:hypothetical protein